MSHYIGFVGSRNFPESSRHLIDEFVARLEKHNVVVSGSARGVDRWSIESAYKYGLRYREYVPDKYNEKGAYRGHYVLMERNGDIISASDEIVAFWDGSSRGTQDSIKRARNAGLKCTIIYPDGTTKVIVPSDNQSNNSSQGTQLNIFGAPPPPTNDIITLKTPSFEYNDKTDLRDIRVEDPSRIESVESQISLAYLSWIYVDEMYFPTLEWAGNAAMLRDNSQRRSLLSEFDYFDNPAGMWEGDRFSEKPGLTRYRIKSLFLSLMRRKSKKVDGLHNRVLMLDDDHFKSTASDELDIKDLILAYKTTYVAGESIYIDNPVVGSIMYIAGWEDIIEMSAPGVYVLPISYMYTEDYHDLAENFFDNYPVLSQALTGLYNSGGVVKNVPFLIELSQDIYVVFLPISEVGFGNEHESTIHFNYMQSVQSLVFNGMLDGVSQDVPLVLPEVRGSMSRKSSVKMMRSILENSVRNITRPIYVHFKDNLN